jgi:UDP-GlcNAc:undecaprenyl-phosphate GlcNAc-1-phosphate transferase
MSFSILLPFVVAAAVAALATPIAARLAHQFGIIDRPNERKVNRRDNIPLLGGLAVGLGFFVSCALIIIRAGDESIYAGRIEGFLVGGALLMAIGAFDDRYTLSWRPKLAAQLTAAWVAIYYGFRIEHFTEPFGLTRWDFHPIVMLVVTTGWIIFITNAMNLLDGLDGLATGVGAIVGATLTYVCWESNQVFGFTVGMALVGALLGFLPFNFSPAKIFLGDTGALLTGFSLSLLALEGYAKATVLTFVVPILALAVPLIDTGLSIVRRALSGRPIFDPDKLHIHHRMLATSGTHRDAVLSIYFLTACFCVIAVSFTRLDGPAAILFLGLVVILTVRLMRNLGFLSSEDPEGG